jgi:hypothetical protein
MNASSWVHCSAGVIVVVPTVRGSKMISPAVRGM